MIFCLTSATDWHSPNLPLHREIKSLYNKNRIIMTATIKDDFMQRIATEEAWKSLSEDFAWTEALLEKNCDKVDWKEISGNRNIIWTIPMLKSEILS